MKKLIDIILVGFVVICTFFNLYHINNLDRFINERIELLDIEPKVIVVDSLVFDTVFIERYEIVRLPIVDTLVRTDTVVAVAVDSVYVELPIELKQFNDTLSNTAISFNLSGYNCKVNSLLVENLKTFAIEENKPKRIGLGLQLGIGATIEGFSPYIGVGISYNLFSF